MSNKTTQKDLDDKFSKIASNLLKEDLDSIAMENFSTDLDFIQLKMKQLNTKQLNEQATKELEIAK